ncbi:beta/gamma crystallin domain-containing protein [Kitasatospora sp. NPDC096147]|uniref:beta/gamma crystallin domain-containing protein n=1 Tax=Kitasatospora sp. NPDC096147 TaxID=3364093 RepID=UPI0038191A73
MALRKRIAGLALAGTATLALTLATAGPAAAIYRVDTNTCNARSDFFTLWNYPPKVCFADNGSTSVAIYDVYQINSGNNSGYFNFTQNGYGYQAYQASWVQSNYNPKIKVTWINITGR